MTRLLLLFSLLVYGNAQDDYLSAQLSEAPRVRCGDSTVKVTLLSTEPFEGNVYAKGFFNKDSCRVKGDGHGNMVNITIPITSDCGMRRRRTINPKGIVIEMTLVLMFHQMLLTKNDKAFHIECVYLELSQKITNRIDVSMLPSMEIRDELSVKAEASVPKCKYEVLNDEKEKLAYAKIGQTIFHRWFCELDQPKEVEVDEDEHARLYCLTVHSCEVDDGHGNMQKLLDYNGCPVDKALLGKINYVSDLEADKKGLVFKFADKPTVYFSCQLRLEVKNDYSEQCSRTSDSCDNFDKGQTVEGPVVGYDPLFPTPEYTVTPTQIPIDDDVVTDGLITKGLPNDSEFGFDQTTADWKTNNGAEGLHGHNSVEVEPSTQIREFDEYNGDARIKAMDYRSSQRNDISASSSHQIFDTQLSGESLFAKPIDDLVSSFEYTIKTSSPKMFAGPSIEFDVNAPGVDVIEVTDASNQEIMPVMAKSPRNIAEFQPQTQICVNRRAFSYSVVVAVCILVMVVVILAILLIRAVKKSRRLNKSTCHRYSENEGVLSAFSP
ncbi:unnamed protein product [Bursaphelenchus xylophilus]|uniref:(pine wood nematode) hypothetical protein n=1 Tax=Bursaphelenchus xylophilus TaxID=6326 RepID=A0A1I7RRN4_BURXY|nr:unnamed protein product [Bursaphelenchus xylophilus]CAG9123615.1 unnamed protein product [Bursaphelenchus xylophilus]